MKDRFRCSHRQAPFAETRDHLLAWEEDYAQENGGYYPSGIHRSNVFKMRDNVYAEVLGKVLPYPDLGIFPDLLNRSSRKDMRGV